MSDQYSRRDIIAGAAAASIAAASAGLAKEAYAQAGQPPGSRSQPATLERIDPKEGEQPNRQGQPPRTPQWVRDGNAPFTRDDAAWKSVLDSARAIMPLPDALGAPMPALTNTVDETFTYSAQPEDEDFYPNHVEQLLNQSADLLDRALSIRREWNELAVKLFETRLAIEEYARLDAIHRRETIAGFYTASARESGAEAEAEGKNAYGQNSAALLLEGLIRDKYSLDEINKQSALAQRAAWVSHFATYKDEHLKDLLLPDFAGAKMSIPDHLLAVATAQSYHNLAVDRNLLRVEHRARAAAVEVAEQRYGARAYRADWELSDVKFRRERTEVARQLADLRAEAYMRSGGALNFAEQMKPLQAQEHRDLRDAIARILAAQKGLAEVYGYAVGLPQAVTTRVSNQQASGQLLDELVMWVRDAIQSLNRFSQLDHNFVVVVPLRGSLTERAWEDGLRTGTWDLAVTEASFPELAHVRVRGVSAFVALRRGGEVETVWHLTVGAPHSATIRHLNGAVLQLDQRRLPVCHLGRVAGRSAVRDPDVVGLNALHNASPLGTWRISILGADQDRRGQLQDVTVDIHVAARQTRRTDRRG